MILRAVNGEPVVEKPVQGRRHEPEQDIEGIG